MHVVTDMYECTLGKQADVISLSTAIMCQSPCVYAYIYTHIYFTYARCSLPLLELTEQSRREAAKNFIPIRT